MVKSLAGKKVLLVAPPPVSDGGPALGLGDIIRLLALAPNIDAAAIGWCSRPGLFALPRRCGFIEQIFSEQELPQRLPGFDAVLNLGFRPIAPGHHEIIVGDLLGGQGTLKARTFDLPATVARAMGIDDKVRWPVATGAGRGPVYDVGFNMRAPAAWAIKQLPGDRWNAVEQALGAGVSVSRQPPERGLEAYISWVEDCRVLASIVGLGCHVAMFLGKPLLTLSGPTDFDESGGYGPGRVMYPPGPCPHRPCHLPNGVDDCGCMAEFDAAAIAATITSLLIK